MLRGPKFSWVSTLLVTGSSRDSSWSTDLGNQTGMDVDLGFAIYLLWLQSRQTTLWASFFICKAGMMRKKKMIVMLSHLRTVDVQNLSVWHTVWLNKCYLLSSSPPSCQRTSHQPSAWERSIKLSMMKGKNDTLQWKKNKNSGQYLLCNYYVPSALHTPSRLSYPSFRVWLLFTFCKWGCQGPAMLENSCK